jgi:hypothetical protein
MLHSLEHLQATVGCAAHTQTLSEKEHQLLDDSTSPRKKQGSLLDRAADVSAANIPFFTMQACTVHIVAVIQPAQPMP